MYTVHYGTYSVLTALGSYYRHNTSRSSSCSNSARSRVVPLWEHSCFKAWNFAYFPGFLWNRWSILRFSGYIFFYLHLYWHIVNSFKYSLDLFRRISCKRFSSRWANYSLRLLKRKVLNCTNSIFRIIY